MANRFYIGLTPLIIFDVVARKGGLGPVWAALASLVTAIGIWAISRRQHATTSLQVSSISFFFALLGISLFAPTTTLDMYSRTFASVGFALVALASMVFGPIIEPYLREVLSVRCSRDPMLRHVSARLSLIWGLLLIGVGAAQLGGRALNTALTTTLGYYLIPIILAMVGCYFTEHCITSNFDVDDIDTLGIHGGFDMLESADMLEPVGVVELHRHQPVPSALPQYGALRLVRTSEASEARD